MTNKTTMPEPFTFFHGYRTQDLNGNKDDKPPMPYVGLPLFTTDQAEAYAAAKVKEALLEAYGSMQELHTLVLNDTSHCVRPAQVASFAANRISALIKSKETT